MIIDIHCHVWEEKYISGELEQIIVNIAKKYDLNPNLFIDGNPDRLVKEMDEAGIDKTVIVALDFDFKFKGKINFQGYNDKVAEYRDKYPERLIPFAGIDPRRGVAAIDELERCIIDLGFQGIKLWPLAGFYPDDLTFYPFYERIQELGIPVFCHTGEGPPGTYLKYCQPMYVDKIAVDFPKIKFILAHLGKPWVNEAISVANKNSNVYLDISSWEPILKIAPTSFIQTLVQAKMTCGVEKILFGTDWPLFSPILCLKKWVKGIQKLKVPPPLQLMGLPEFTEEEKSKILGENAKRVLNLDEY
jgi:predicted TIM-barrel fold metal-dependent hydrolase